MQEITTGDFLVAVRCPHCDCAAEVPAVLEQVLKVKGREGSLTVALSAKAIPHDCGQEQLPFDDEDQVVTPGQEMLRDGVGVAVGADATFTAIDPETGEIHEVGRGVRL